MRSITLTPTTLASIGNLAAFTGAGKHGSPILDAIGLSVAGGELIAVATDRYTVAQYSTTHDDTEELPQVAIPAALIVQAVKAAKGAASITLTHDDTGDYTSPITFTWEGGTIAGQTVAGNLPAVERLLTGEPTDLPQGTRINPAYLARLAKLTDPTGRKPADRAIAFDLSALGTNLHAAGGDYRVLICPIRKP